MKKLVLTIGLAALSSMAFAQSAFDAIRLSQTNPVLGTARYSGMAGAFSALGGNPSAIKDNPAALGVYRSMDFTFTPSVVINNDGNANAALDNFAFVINFGDKKRKHGYVTSSLGINYNRLNNITRYSRGKKTAIPYSVTDYFYDYASDNVYSFAQELELLYLPGEDPTYPDGGSSKFGGNKIMRDYKFVEKGHVGQWDIAYGLNISNLVYIGAALGINTLEYKQTTMYNETDPDSPVYDHWYLDNQYWAEGHGVNFRIGAIVRPTDEVRVGMSIETPTRYHMREWYRTELGSDYDRNRSQRVDDYGGEDQLYTLRTPLRFKTGVGFVIGKKAMIDLDYQYENYKKIRMSIDDIELDSEADLLDKWMNKTHTLKVGAEMQVTDGFFVRLGAACVSKPMQNLTSEEAKYANMESLPLLRPLSIPQNSFYGTGGVGYKGEHFYCDMAYVLQNQKEYVYPNLPTSLYPRETPVKENVKTHNIIATFGWRF